MSDKPRSVKPKSAAVSYDRRVFINCPFDNDYLPLLQAIAFAVIDCGFSPRLAIQEVNGRLRLEKMIDLMRASRLSIHDISRLPAAPGELPGAVSLAKLSAGEILSFDYLSDLVELMADWIKARP